MMRSALKATLVVLFEAMAIAFAIFFFWRVQQQYTAIAQSALVEMQSGSAFLLLPLILPILHLMSIAETRFANGAHQAKFRKMQSRFFIVFVVMLVAIGFVVNQMVLSTLNQQGYQACELVVHQTRTSFTFYSKDLALCPES
ncbi:hypothetical protein [Arsukibacterium sp.]|uniref:hypothetical protein n=1 Tax=Arsukibacterium sp. TaxID=1977258 RepID=UPI00299E3B42|nr:hypothetical protein [Arsukibacterium sp.]MDX1537066.1 hypothetical protein [Arsukibacterium sp.]